MNVEIAEERLFVLTDRFNMEQAETRAWAKRVEAFGAMAAIGGFLSRPKDEEFEVVYRERRLQPFWRLASRATYAYERRREHPLVVGPEVVSIDLLGETRQVVGGRVSVSCLEHCKEDRQREHLIDGLDARPHPEYAPFLDCPAVPSTSEALAAMSTDGMVVVPPQARPSMLVRDAVAQAIGKIDADKVLEETVRLEAVDLYYRPVFAFRYRRTVKDKPVREAVVEVDALTGLVKATGGSTFEALMGKAIDPKFLLDIGIEAANIFIPGATVAKLAIVRGLEMRDQARAKNTPS